MSAWRLILFLILVFSVNGYAQVPSAAPTPPADDDVVKISTNLIQFDISVVDKDGKAITDLRPDELEVFENKKKQTVTNLSFISSAAKPSQTVEPANPNGIPIPSVELRPENIRRTIALVIDDLTLSFESAYQTRRTLKKFVDEQMQPGDLVAILRTGAGIGALQQFTSDKRQLYAAIEKVRWNPNGSGGISVFAPVQASAGDEEETDDASEELAQTGSGQTLDDYRTSVFVTGTLGALRYIVTGMAQLPGRKSVILFSDGFNLLENEESGAQTQGLVLDFMRQLVDSANRAAVVFYTIDARGLVATGLNAADASPGTSPEALSDAVRSRNQELADTQDGLVYLAQETGGFALINNNDLSRGVQRVLDDQSYYLVGYEPDSETFDPAKRAFNQLSVKVLRKGATVRSRSGFYNVPDKPEKAMGTTSKPTAVLPPAIVLENALVSPFAVAGIELKLNALFGGDAKQGGFVRSLLHIKAGDLKFTDEKDGSKRAGFEILAMSFGDNGQVVDRHVGGYTLSLKPDAFRKVSVDGFIYSFVFPVKKAGAYQFRVALRDTFSGKVGSASQFIEVPELKKDRLTLSGIVLESITPDQWQQRSNERDNIMPTDPIADTALRRVRVGNVLRYSFEIYNARSEGGKPPQIETQIRVYRDGKIFLEGKNALLDTAGQSDLRRLKHAGAVALGRTITPGDYILQIIVTDRSAKGKQKISTEYVQFEVVG